MARVELETSRGRVVLDLAPDPADAPTLLDTIRQAGLPIGQSCRGEGVCRSCVVDVEAGAAALLPLTALEVRFRFTPERRLACQAVIPPGDVRVRLHHPGWGRSAAPGEAPRPDADGTLDP